MGKRQPEGKLATSIIARLRERFGGFWYKVHTGGPYGRPGIPDICGVVDGWSVWLEVKLPGRVRITDNQQKVISELEEAHALVAVVTSEEEALLAVLEGLAERKSDA